MSAVTKRGRRWRLTPLQTGAVVVVLAMAVGLFAFERQAIFTVLEPGDTIAATFERDYRLRSYVSEVKIAGVPVGTVESSSAGPDGQSRVSMKLDPGTADKLGTDPSASIRPSTLLGGKYFVELAPGGEPGPPAGDIPRDRTRIAVEADSVVETLQPDARAGAQQFADKVDQSLRQGAAPALKNLAADAPGALQPSAPVLDALTGDHPDTLRTTVAGLDSTGRVLTAQDGQIEQILASFNTTTRVLDQQRQPVADAVGQFPETLRTARQGLGSLGGSLDKLTGTAADLRPTARQLDPLLTRLDPVLVKARPVVADLRSLLGNARPLVDDLVPTSSDATEVLGNVGGPVLDRVNGPILTALNTPFDGKGTGRYDNSSSPYLTYQDIAYAFTNANGAAKYTDRNGASLTIQVGQSPDAVQDVQGVPNMEDLLRQLIDAQRSPR